MAEASGTYAKGSLLDCDRDWYHGELSRVQAEQALAVSGYDCFLVRVSEGALILSLIYHGQLHHFNIKYGRGWYELEGSSAQYSFIELEELVSHYSSHDIGALKITLGVTCEKTGKDSLRHHGITSEIPHHYDTTPKIPSHEIVCIYAKGKPEDLTKHTWYHGNITQEQAEAALKGQPIDNGFLVRVSNNNLVLSSCIRGWVHHDTIHRSPKGYQLDKKDKVFKSVPEMITHYQQHPIDHSGQVLGTAIATVPSGQQLRDSPFYETIKFRKEESKLKISWKKYADLPTAISSPQVVKIGDWVYVGGGMRNTGNKRVFRFSMSQGTWTSLPFCPTFQHGLTSLNSELIAIGGKEQTESVNTVYTFQDGEWMKILPPMPTPRYGLSTTSHDNRLVIAAGGTTLKKSNGENVGTNVVEIYIGESQTWFSTNPLPFPISIFSMCIISNTCYILGGTTCRDKAYIALYATMYSLLENANPSQQHLLPWKQLEEDHPLCASSLVELDGIPTTMGGSSEVMQRHGTRFIGKYDITSATWVECKGAELPVPLYRAGVVKLDSNQVMIVGGQPKSQQFSAAVYIGRCYKARKAKS